MSLISDSDFDFVQNEASKINDMEALRAWATMSIFMLIPSNNEMYRKEIEQRTQRIIKIWRL